MASKSLREIIKRAESWPDEAQEELVEIASEIEASLEQGSYRATYAELIGIDRGIEAARDGRLVNPQDVEAAFAKYRRK